MKVLLVRRGRFGVASPFAQVGDCREGQATPRRRWRNDRRSLSLLRVQTQWCQDRGEQVGLRIVPFELRVALAVLVFDRVRTEVIRILDEQLDLSVAGLGCADRVAQDVAGKSTA